MLQALLAQEVSSLTPAQDNVSLALMDALNAEDLANALTAHKDSLE